MSEENIRNRRLGKVLLFEGRVQASAATDDHTTELLR